MQSVAYDSFAANAEREPYDGRQGIERRFGSLEGDNPKMNRLNGSGIIATVAVIGLVATTVAYGANSGAPAVATSGAPSLSLNVGYTQGGSALKWFVAQEKGFFAERGLHVNPIGFSGGIAAATALKAGSVDINLTAATGVATAISAGVDIKTFYASYDESAGDWLVARKDSTITGIQNLKGATIGTSRGSTAWVCLMSMLKSEGLVGHVDIKDIKGQAWVPAMQSRSVDAIQGWPPAAQQIVQSLGGRKIADCSSYARETIIWEAPAEVLKTKKEAVLAWVAGMEKAGKWIGENRSEAAVIWSKYSGVPAKDAASALPYIEWLTVKDMLDPKHPSNMVNASGLARQYATYRTILDEGKIFPNPLPDLAKSIDPSLIKEYEGRQ